MGVESSLPCWQFVDIPNVTDPSSDCALLLDVAAPVCHCAIPAPTTLPLTLGPTPATSNGTWPPSATPAPTYQEPCDLRCHNNTNTSSNTTATNDADFENNATSVQGGGGINRTLQVTIAGTVVSCGQLLDWAEQRFLSPEVCDAASQSLCGECPVATTPTAASPVVDDIANTTTTVTTLPPTATPLTTEIGRDVSSGAGEKTSAASATAAAGCLLVLFLSSSSSSWMSLA